MDSLLEEQRKINQELMNEMKNMQMQASVLGTGSGKNLSDPTGFGSATLE